MGAEETASHFLQLHRPGTPLIVPNPWDAGSARILQSLGFAALATTSSGFAMTLGRSDGEVTRDEALAHAAAVVAAVSVPVSADLENGFGRSPAEVVATYDAAISTGLAGGSLEDFDGTQLYPVEVAVERVAAAAEVTRGRFVLTARAENHIRGNPELADTINRLQRYQEAGADVLYAPGVVAPADVRTLLAEVDRPVNVLLLPGGAGVAELAELGVSRISVGGAFAYVAVSSLVDAGRELLAGQTGFFDRVPAGRSAAQAAFSSPGPAS